MKRTNPSTTKLHRLRIGVSTCHPLNLIEMLRTVELRLYKNLVVEIVTAYSFELMAISNTMTLILSSSHPHRRAH